MRGPDRRTVRVERRLRGQQADAERKLWFASESAKDADRDARLRKEGCRVMRFWNNDVLSHRESVLETILSALQ
jgi:very-short-patch-repair endonuclease